MYKKLAHIMLAILAIAGLGLTGCMDGETPTLQEKGEAGFNGSASLTGTTTTGAGSFGVQTITALAGTINGYNGNFAIVQTPAATGACTKLPCTDTVKSGKVVTYAVSASAPKTIITDKNDCDADADITEKITVLNARNSGSYNASATVSYDKNGNITSLVQETAYSGNVVPSGAGITGYLDADGACATVTLSTDEDQKVFNGAVTTTTENTWSGIIDGNGDGDKVDAGIDVNQLIQSVVTVEIAAGSTVTDNKKTESPDDDVTITYVEGAKTVTVTEKEWNRVLLQNRTIKTTVTNYAGKIEVVGDSAASREQSLTIIAIKAADPLTTVTVNDDVVNKKLGLIGTDVTMSASGTVNSGTGWAVLTTPVARFKPWDSTSGCPEAGHQTVKVPYSTLDVVYNADQSVDVYSNGVLSASYDDCNGF